MAIMVYSFRESFDHWLGKLLPADLQLREPFGNDTAFWSPEVQARLVAVGGVPLGPSRHRRPAVPRPEPRIYLKGPNQARRSALRRGYRDASSRGGRHRGGCGGPGEGIVSSASSGSSNSANS